MPSCPARLAAEFGRLLDEFTGVLGREAVGVALGPDLTRLARRQAAEARDRLRHPLTVAVIGDFKRGKTTLLNALVGTAVLPTDVTPETVTINRLEHGPERRAAAHLADGRVVTLDPDRLDRKHLAPVLERLPGPLDHVTVTTPAEGLRGLALVDTPGLGDLFNRFDERVRAYLHECDALVVVVSALSPLSETEREFLRAAVIPQEFPKILFVLNMMDTLEITDDADRVVRTFGERLMPLFPGAAVFPLSALDELRRVQGKPRPRPAREEQLTAGFAAFRRQLDQAVVLNRDLIALYRAAGLLARTATEVRQRLELVRDSMSRDRAGLAKAIAECEDRTSDLHKRAADEETAMRAAVARLGAEAEAWMDDFLTRLDEEVFAKVGDFAHEDISKHFHFFVVDRLRQALTDCLAAHQPALIQLSASARGRLAERVAGTTAAKVDSLGVARATFGDLPWTGTDVVQFALLFVPGAGWLLHLLFGSGREQEREGGRAKWLADKVRGALPGVRDNTRSQVRATYARIADDMVGQVRTAYEADVAGVLAAMKQAEQLRGRGAEHAEAAVARALLEIEDVGVSLISFRNRLSGPDHVAAG